MLIGLDFDNTIAGYDDVFVAVATEMGVLREGEAVGKKGVRDALMKHPLGERQWMTVQGRVYGARINEATLIEGVSDFLLACRKMGQPVCVISHKTEFGHFDEERINLREAATAWMEARGFFSADGFAIAPGAIYFETTRQSKVGRIAALGCSHFIDDLPEVFLEPGFPQNTKRYLLACGERQQRSSPVASYRTWAEISEQILTVEIGDG